MKMRKVLCGSWGRRDAYSLTEVLLATALSSLVMSQAGIALISSARMVEATTADMELSLQSRALREKLLYHINADGGMMSACQSGLSLVSGSGTIKGLRFKPVNGQQNTVTVNDSKKLVASQSLNTTWLNCGTMVFQGTNLFSLSSGTGTVDSVTLTLDMALKIASRTYSQRNLVKVQIMNNK